MFIGSEETPKTLHKLGNFFFIFELCNKENGKCVEIQRSNGNEYSHYKGIRRGTLWLIRYTTWTVVFDYIVNLIFHYPLNHWSNSVDHKVISPSKAVNTLIDVLISNRAARHLRNFNKLNKTLNKTVLEKKCHFQL